jgi:hypothetical protein
MASTFSNLGLNLQATGENSGTWGAITNVNLQEIDNAISGVYTLTVTGSTTLAFTTNSSSTTYTDEAGRNKTIILSGSLTSTTITVTVPNIEKDYYIINNSGATAVISSGGSTTVSIATGSKNIVIVNPSVTSVLTALPADQVNSPGGTTTNVQYNLAGVFAGSTSFTFDGTTVSAINVSASGTVYAANHIGTNVTVSGNITGSTVFATNLTVSGTATATNFVGTNVTVSGNITGSTVFASNVTVSGNITGSTVFASNVTVSGSVTFTTATGTNATVTNFTATNSTTVNAVFSSTANFLTRSEVRFQDAAGGEYVGLRSSTTVSASYTLNLPTATGTANQVIQTDGSGNLSFATVSGGAAWQAVTSSATFNATAKYGYFVNTSGNAITCTLPASPTLGDFISFVDYNATFDTNNFTVSRNGNPIQGSATDLTVATERAGFTLVYVDATQGWLLQNN